ncbi:hypothetical protein ACC739_30175 [Rhizobium ruizarguesonis]
MKSTIEVSVDGGLAAHVDLQPRWRQAWQTAFVILREEGAIRPSRLVPSPVLVEQLIDPEINPKEVR